MEGRKINPAMIELIEIGNKFGGTRLFGSTPEERRRSLKDALNRAKAIKAQIEGYGLGSEGWDG